MGVFISVSTTKMRETNKRRPKRYRDISIDKIVSTKDLGGKGK